MSIKVSWSIICDHCHILLLGAAAMIFYNLGVWKLERLSLPSLTSLVLCNTLSYWTDSKVMSVVNTGPGPVFATLHFLLHLRMSQIN